MAATRRSVAIRWSDCSTLSPSTPDHRPASSVAPRLIFPDAGRRRCKMSLNVMRIRPQTSARPGRTCCYHVSCSDSRSQQTQQLPSSLSPGRPPPGTHTHPVSVVRKTKEFWRRQRDGRVYRRRPASGARETRIRTATCCV